MAIEAKENSLGAKAFLAGVVLAILIGLSTSLIPIPALKKYSSAIYAILVLLGLFIGFTIKVSQKDSQTFMIAGAILVIVSKFGMDSVHGSLIGIGVGDTVAAVFGALLALFVPATIIVAIKNLFGIARV
ncbi:MAG: hypothetical protein Q8P15_01260 [Nanoarchaeota archaeon]|nr:hypothetical protein [Nanoarchaeota archaeon]